MSEVRQPTTRSKRGLNRFVIAAVLAGGCTVAVTAARAPAVALPHVAPAQRLTGTVSAVDTRARTFDLVTGVGYALRIRRVHLPPELKLKAGRPSTVEPALAPGSIVRVEFRQTASGAVASSVEVLQTPPRKEKP
jgi:hypothetical protein